jgi:hypothetical protein
MTGSVFVAQIIITYPDTNILFYFFLFKLVNY